MISSGGASGNCFFIITFQRVRKLSVLSEDFMGLVAAVCCCVCLQMFVYLCTPLIYSASFWEDFVVPSLVLCWDGPFLMVRRKGAGFPCDCFEKWSDNVCRSLLMQQSACWHNQFGNNQGDWENGLIKWFAWVISSVWNAVVNTLICFHPSCLSTPLSPWNWVTLWFWPLFHRCKKRPLWCCGLKYFTFEGSASWVRFWDRWYSQKSLPVCFYLIRTAHLGSDFQSKELSAWLLTIGLKHFQ